MEIGKINNYQNYQSFGMAAKIAQNVIKEAGKAGGDEALRLNTLMDYFDAMDGIDLLVSKTKNKNFFSDKLIVQLFDERGGIQSVIVKMADFVKRPTDALREMGLKETADDIDNIYKNLLTKITRNSNGMNSEFPNNRTRVEYVDRFVEMLPNNSRNADNFIIGEPQRISSSRGFSTKNLENMRRPELPQGEKRTSVNRQIAPSKSEYR